MEKYAFNGKILIIGFGSLGQGVLPLLLRHFNISPKNITAIAADNNGEEIARENGINFVKTPLTIDNYEETILSYLGKGDFLLNLSVNVSSVDLIKLCQPNGILYLDACIEPWLGGYSDPSLSLSERSNYGQRENALVLKNDKEEKTTAVVAHGANPGIISHFLKRALLNVARDVGHNAEKPNSKEGWAKLAKDLGIKTIHIAEYDTQVSEDPKKIGRFENTWSVTGFHDEGANQPSELGWGTHEKSFPKDAKKHDYGCGSAIYLERPGVETLVRTWTPARESFIGRMITHNEAISISDFFTLKDGEEVIYRPTVHYAYRPCDAAVLSIEESVGNNLALQDEQKILVDEIVSGMDELGVLLMGHKKNTYWYGSQLTIEEARKLAPYQNATGLQVNAGVLGAMVWAIENPNRGVVEADDMDFERVMEVVKPYMGTMVGKYSDWTPLEDRRKLFPEPMDENDPWQFDNFRV
ncbi:MAG: saccharopine dehydrogenase C-terminal domain-containing protein [Candidatus Paceibacterota bacterium]|jgi:homospermidine synthase